MKSFFYQYGTPFTVTLFLVSAISGAALFVGVGQGLFRSMHEILSMVLLVPFVVHMWRNWRPLVNYFRHAAMPLAITTTLAASAFFMYLGLSGPTGGNPMFALANAAQNAPLAVLAPVLKSDASELVARLAAAGIAPAAATDSVADIAKASGHDSFEIVATLVAPAQ